MDFLVFRIMGYLVNLERIMVYLMLEKRIMDYLDLCI